ncbi:hypothetical protein B0H16DRAFT_1480243 [Mycena metata]|uniref:Uncharacterized protein n=1 Tax=Mycena metata TaxID=1033252 RepID=A0AAD7H4B5_9AGAR|nr:hypothetical protein B0H16DRAFT_1480243 [Mycena metata]
MPVPLYTIDNVLPRLYALSLPPDALSSPFYIPNEGFPNFLQYCMRVFTHTLLRAITHDFIHTESLPGLPRMELLKLHEWIEILMLHFRLVSRTLKIRTETLSAGDLSWLAVPLDIPAEAFQMLKLCVYLCDFVAFVMPTPFEWIEILMLHFRLVSRTLKIRTETLSAGDLSWLAVPLDIPAEAFQMLKLCVYLCDFVAFVMPTPFPADHNARILYPLMELSKRQVLLTGAQSDYAEYDSRGQYEPASLLFSHAGTVQNAQHNVILSPTPLHSVPLAIGFTDSPLFLEEISSVLRDLNGLPGRTEWIFLRICSVQQQKESGHQSNIAMQLKQTTPAATKARIELFFYPSQKAHLGDHPEHSLCGLYGPDLGFITGNIVEIQRPALFFIAPHFVVRTSNECKLHAAKSPLAGTCSTVSTWRREGMGGEGKGDGWADKESESERREWDLDRRRPQRVCTKLKLSEG